MTILATLVLLLHVTQRLVNDGCLGRLELPSWDTALKQFVNLLKAAALELGDEEEKEHKAEEIGARPDITIFGALEVLANTGHCEGWHAAYPIHVVWVDEIRRAKARQPG